MMKTLRPFTPQLHRTHTSAIAFSRRAAYLSKFTNHDRYNQQRRDFFANPFGNSEPQKISETRTLPYSSSDIFKVITNISDYKAIYMPLVKQSIVTKTSSPASDKQAYPEEARLSVGWNDTATEEFWSRVYCAPDDLIVESVSGKAETTLSEEQIRHHHPRPAPNEDPTRKDDVLEHLITRWKLRPLKGDSTEVHLSMEWRFANPIYAALSQAAVPKVGPRLIDAFDRRLQSLANEKDRDQ